MMPSEISPSDEDTIDLRAYLAVLGRHWKLMALVVLVGVSSALALSLREPSQYRARSELLVRQRDSTSIISNTPVVQGNEAVRALNNEVKLFESGSVVAAVAEVYDGPLNPKSVKASVASESSDVIAATMVASDPEEAAALVNLYVSTFIEVRRTERTDELLSLGSEIQTKIDELTTQIATIRAPLTDLENRLALDPENQALIDQRDSLAGELANQLDPLTSQRAFYQKQIDDLEVTATITQSGGARVLTLAEAPETPVSPKPVRDAVIALILSLVLAVALAFLLDTIDERIRSVGDLELVTRGLPTFALIPEVDRGHDERFVALRDDPRGLQAEAFRSLRTAVKFAALDQSIKVIQLTSASQGEGKTTVVANLALALAQGGDRVAVVCCDLRRPRVQERFDVGLTPGFTDVLMGDAPLADALRRYDTGVLILPAGSPPPNPSELLSSNKAAAVIRALTEEFDIVLVDSTPVLPVTDALVVSRFVDATIVVADSRSTTRKAVTRTLQMLAQVNAPVIGVVLNGLPEGGRYGYGYGYGQDDARAERSSWLLRRPSLSRS
jgi:capsular exopolysaccharide synthesis family protein